MTKNKVTKGGFILFGIGAIFFIIGFSLFISVFFAMGARDIWHWNYSTFPEGMDPSLPGHAGPMTLFQRGVVGFILMALGAIMVKIGLGLGLFGNIENIMAWLENLFNKGPANKLPADNSPSDSSPANVFCPACGKGLSRASRFCNRCGAKIE